jgi:hypothetical protein
VDNEEEEEEETEKQKRISEIEEKLYENFKKLSEGLSSLTDQADQDRSGRSDKRLRSDRDFFDKIVKRYLELQIKKASLSGPTASSREKKDLLALWNKVQELEDASLKEKTAKK